MKPAVVARNTWIFLATKTEKKSSNRFWASQLAAQTPPRDVHSVKPSWKPYLRKVTSDEKTSKAIIEVLTKHHF